MFKSTYYSLFGLQSVDIFALDYDAILAAMYALTISAEGDCYLCVPPDLGIEAAALGASDTTVTPLPAPVAVRLADPSGGPVLARSSTVIPCPAVPSGSLSACVDLHVYMDGPSPGHVHPSAWVESVHTGHRASSGTAASAQVSASGPVAPPCSCRLLSHQTLLWHHRLGHPSLPRLRGMHSRLLVSGLPRSLPPLPPSPAPPCLPCIKGQQRAAPHSSSLPPTTAPLQTLNMDIRGPVASVERAASANFWWLLMTTRVAPRSSPCTARFYHPTMRRVLPSQDVTFDESIPIYRPPPVDPLPPQRPAPSGVSQVDPLSFTEPVEVAVNFCATGVGAARGAASGGAEPERAKPGGAEPGVAESEGAEPGGAESDRAEPGSGGAEPGGTVSPGGPTGASSQREPLSPPQLHEWFAWYTRLRSGAAGAGGPAAIVSGDAGTGAAGPGGARAAGPGGARNGGAGAGGTGGVRAAGPRGARSGGTGAAGGGGGAGLQGAGGALGAGGAGAADPGGARTGGPGAAGAGGVAGAGAGDSVAGEPGA
ncbi:unnamed protein product [Closterium sp. NIES-53]